jgi:hypothetical protein
MIGILLGWMIFLDDSAATCTVTRSDGNNLVGAIVSLDETELILDVGPSNVTIPRSQILAIESSPTIVERPAEVAILLRGQGILRADRITTDDRTATIELAGLDPIVLPLSALLGIVWEGADRAELLARYRRLAVPSDRDKLVAVRGNERATLEGIVGPISPTHILFTMDNQPVEVKRERVREIGFAIPSADSRPAAILFDRQGNLWPLEQVSFSSHRWTGEGATMGRREWEADEVARVDFSAARVTYLSDLEPSIAQHTPYFDHAWTYQRDRNLVGQPLTLSSGENSTKTYAKGLAVHSKTILTYTLAPDDLRFVTDLGLDPRTARGGVQVTISQDDVVLWNGAIASGDVPVSLHLPLVPKPSLRRLTLLVDFGLRGDIGDHVILGDARLVK